jgi:hypothetical protein
MNWINVKDELPEVYEDVLVWVKHENVGFMWEEACLDDQEKKKSKFSYKEPNTQKYWMMGSAKNYKITHWLRIDKPILGEKSWS